MKELKIFYNMLKWVKEPEELKLAEQRKNKIQEQIDFAHTVVDEIGEYKGKTFEEIFEELKNEFESIR